MAPESGLGPPLEDGAAASPDVDLLAAASPPSLQAQSAEASAQTSPPTPPKPARRILRIADPTALGPTTHGAYLRSVSPSMGPASVSRRFQRAAAAAAVAFTFALAPPVGCSSGGDGPPACVSSHCPPGNECIDDGSGKGASCQQVCTSSSECPFNSSCNDGQPKSWCTANTYSVPQQPSGQWGAPCVPS